VAALVGAAVHNLVVLLLQVKVSLAEITATEIAPVAAVALAVLVLMAQQEILVLAELVHQLIHLGV
jgi:hypothetical protein